MLINLLAEMSTGAAVGMVALGLVIGAAASLVLARTLGIQSINAAKREAEQILQQARNEGKTLQKQIELDARNDLAKLREQFEKETTDSRNELKDAERRLVKREDNLDRKLDVLATKERFLDEQEQKVKKAEKRIDGEEDRLKQLVKDHEALIEHATQQQQDKLLWIAKLSEEDARREAIAIIEREVQHEAAQLIQREMDKANEEIKNHAQKITLQAIQRYASEHTANGTVSAIPIPSDDLKGRVIGREGRNIRAFEKSTGVDVIVDDTPGVVVVSCFDPVRRAVASESMQRLVEDGRIHPTRIEEIVEQVQKDVDERIVKFGKDAAIEANIQGLHGRISEMMGRLYYRTSYGQNILRHSLEVAYLCQVIADELGLDGAIARRCGFLHDIGKAMDHDIEGGHPKIGMDFCKKFNESEEVLNAIGGHHSDIPATSPYTAIVMAADAISGARPGARRETLEKYVKRLEQLEGIANEMKGVRQSYAIQAGREVRVVVDPEGVDDAGCVCIARDIAKRVSEEMTFPGEIRVTVLRELRTVEYAR